MERLRLSEMATANALSDDPMVEPPPRISPHAANQAKHQALMAQARGGM